MCSHTFSIDGHMTIAVNVLERPPWWEDGVMKYFCTVHTQFWFYPSLRYPFVYFYIDSSSGGNQSFPFSLSKYPNTPTSSVTNAC